MSRAKALEFTQAQGTEEFHTRNFSSDTGSLYVGGQQWEFCDTVDIPYLLDQTPLSISSRSRIVEKFGIFDAQRAINV